MFIFTVLASLALAQLRAGHTVLEALAVLLQAPRSAAVASFHVPKRVIIGQVGSRCRLQGV